MTPIRVVPDPRPRFWTDPLPRHTWEYHRSGRFSWRGDYGPVVAGDEIGLCHSIMFTAFTERGIRRKLARKIRAERREAWTRYVTRRESRVRP